MPGGQGRQSDPSWSPRMTAVKWQSQGVVSVQSKVIVRVWLSINQEPCDFHYPNDEANDNKHYH